MLTEYFESPSRIQEIRSRPDGHLLEGFAQGLCEVGYAEITARRHLRSAEHLVHWTGRRGIAVTDLEERFIGEFSHHLNRCRCPRYGRSHRREFEKGVRLFLRYLRRAGVLTTPIKEESIEEPALLVSFGRWMRQQRGTCDATLYNYGLDLRDLLKDVGEDPAAFHAQILRNFVLETTQQCGWAAAKRCITAVRAFLRFLIADGKCAAGLDAAIPALAHWRLSTLPRYLQSEEVERVIASCDPHAGRYEGSRDSTLARPHGSSRGRHRATSSGRHRLEGGRHLRFREGPSSDTAAADSGDWRCDRCLYKGRSPSDRL